MQNSTPSLISRDQSMDATGLYIVSLGCGLDATYIDAPNRACLLVLPGWGCTNKEGAIDLAKTLLPEVQVIGTCNEFGWDCAYTLQADGRWQFNDLSRQPEANWSLMGSLMESRQSRLSEDQLIEKLLESKQFVLDPSFECKYPDAVCERNAA